MKWFCLISVSSAITRDFIFGDKACPDREKIVHGRAGVRPQTPAITTTVFTTSWFSMVAL
jgi:hypothetical protein